MSVRYPQGPLSPRSDIPKVRYPQGLVHVESCWERKKIASFEIPNIVLAEFLVYYNYEIACFYAQTEEYDTKIRPLQ